MRVTRAVTTSPTRGTTGSDPDRTTSTRGSCTRNGGGGVQPACVGERVGGRRELCSDGGGTPLRAAGRQEQAVSGGSRRAAHLLALALAGGDDALGTHERGADERVAHVRPWACLVLGLAVVVVMGRWGGGGAVIVARRQGRLAVRRAQSPPLLPPPPAHPAPTPFTGRRCPTPASKRASAPRAQADRRACRGRPLPCAALGGAGCWCWVRPACKRRSKGAGRLRRAAHARWTKPPPPPASPSFPAAGRQLIPPKPHRQPP